MKKIYLTLSIIALFVLHSCGIDSLSGVEETDRTVRIEFSAGQGGKETKSSVINDETTVENLNVWVYSSAAVLVETHYFESEEINGSSVSFETDAGAGSMVVLLANAGAAMTPPQHCSDTFELSYTDACGMLMTGNCTLSPGPAGLQGSVRLSRLMARITLDASLASPLRAAGGVLGDNVRIRSLRLCNCTGKIGFYPDSPYSSGRVYKAEEGDVLSVGDYLSDADLSLIHSGGSVCLYALPNYTAADYSDTPGPETELSTFIEMIVDYDAFGGTGGGSAYCRFYASDGSEIGLQGGCDYRVSVLLSNDVAKALWRKDDFRLCETESLIAGTSRHIDLLQEKPAGEGTCLFSLSESGIVEDDGIFSLSGRSVSGTVKGIVLTALRAGNDTVYVFDRNPSEGGVPLGVLPVSSYLPDLSIDELEVDVTGLVGGLSVNGRPSLSECASGDLYQELYVIDSLVEVPGSARICGEDFIAADPVGENMYVNFLSWQKEDEMLYWNDAVGSTLHYKAYFACGVEVPFDVRVVDDVVGPLGKSAYFGEVFDMSEVEYPKDAVATLGNVTSLGTPYLDATIPASLRSSSWQSEGWASWYGGDLHTDGTPADQYVSGRTTSRVSWNFPLEVLREEYGTIPVYIGKMNPWCMEYVKARAGYFYSTKYVPTGVDIFINSVGFDSWGRCSYDGSLEAVYTVLIFRAHDSYATLDTNPSSFAHESPGYNYTYMTGIGNGGYVVFDYDGVQYLETNWQGDIEPYLEDEVRIKYSLPALNSYSPYTVSPAVKTADSVTGKTNAHGIVHVHKWSVSEKVYFDYDHEPWYNRVQNGDYCPEWR